MRFYALLILTGLEERMKIANSKNPMVCGKTKGRAGIDSAFLVDFYPIFPLTNLKRWAMLIIFLSSVSSKFPSSAKLTGSFSENSPT